MCPSDHETRSSRDDGPRQLRTAVGSFWQRIRARFTVDTRALAAYRIALASLVLLDLLRRSRHLELFYTDRGVYPRAAYEATYTQYNGVSLHALSGDLWFQQLLFVVAAVVAVVFLLGYRTRLAGAVSFLLLLSLHARNPAVLNGGDGLFRILLVLSLLVPLGERWSVDALRRGEAREQVCTFGTAAVLLQPVVVFTANAILKHDGEHWYAGEALEIALLNDSMRFHLGNVIVDYPALMTTLNYTWVTLLAGSALFLLGTVGRSRALAALGYLGVFFGMSTAMAVGLFPFLLMASVLPFLTAPFWETLGRLAPARWRDRLPDRNWLGPLAKPPLERRLLDRLDPQNRHVVTEFARSLLTAVGFLTVVWMLSFAASDVTGRDVPDAVDSAHLDQQEWGLYAPDPSEGYDWYVTEAELVGGQSIDVSDGGAVEFDRPPDATAAYESYYHRKFMNLVEASADDDTSPVVARSYGEWACQRAATEYDEPVERVIVHRLYQWSPLDGSYDEPNRWTIIERDCEQS